MKIVPADDATADLKKKAAECEEQARKQDGTMAAQLHRKGGGMPLIDRRAQEWK
jgi:hypothetical protein